MKIQFYGTSSWETTYYDILRTVKGEEKYDGTMNQLQVELIATFAPKDRFTKCRVIMEDTTALTYQSDGRPLNHQEFVVQSSDVQVHTNYTKQSYNLIEPTYVLKFVRMESLTFTSIPKITVKELVNSVWTDVEYTQEPYTLFTTLERILKVTRVKTSVDDQSFYPKVRIMNDTLLKATALNSDDQFKENTLYDAIRKLGDYINLVPVLYFGKSTKEYDLWFERKDGLDKTAIAWETISANAQGYVLSQTSDLGADTVVSDVENMISATVANGIAEDWYGYATYEDDILLPSDIEKKFLELNQSIGEVAGLYRYTHKTNAQNQTTFYVEKIKCVEKKEWNLLDNSPDTTKLRDRSAYFIEGENKINFGTELLNQLNNNINYIWSVRYYPSISGKVISSRTTSPKYETTFNQSDSMVDAGTYGNMLREYIRTNGNSDITLTSFVGAYSSIYAVGTPVTKGSENYIITSVSYVQTGNGFQVTYQLNKNATRRHENVRASQKIREYGVQYENNQVRYTNVRDVTLIGLSNVPQGLATISKYLFDKTVLLGGLMSSLQQVYNQSKYPQLAFLSLSSSVKRNGSAYTSSRFRMANYAASRVGKSIIFNIKALNNIHIGKNVVLDPTKTQKLVKYTDPFGQVEQLQVVIAPYDSSITNEVNLEALPEFTETEVPYYTQSIINNLYTFAKTYPESNLTRMNTAIANRTIDFSLTSYLKDMREVMNITYQLDFLGLNCVVHDRLIDRSGFLGKFIKFETINGTPTLVDDVYLYFVISNNPMGENDVVANGSSDLVHFERVTNPTVGTNSISFALANSQVISNKTVSLCYYVGTTFIPLISRNNVSATYTNVVVSY